MSVIPDYFMRVNNELEKLWKYRSTDKSLARTGRKQATATKLWLLQATQKKIQTVVCPTRSQRQQWPPRRAKNGDLSMVFSVGLG